MGTKEKLIQRFLSLPTDFTWDEMHRLLVSLGYSPDNKGKTSGSRVILKVLAKDQSCSISLIREK